MMMLSEIFSWLEISRGSTQLIDSKGFIAKAEVYVQEKFNALDNVLYIIEASNYNIKFKLPKYLLIVCDDVTATDDFDENIAVIYSEKDINAICLSINEEIQHHALTGHIVSKLMRIAEHDDFLEKVIDELYTLFENPIAYFDYKHTVITYRGNDKTGVYVWDHSMENR